MRRLRLERKEKRGRKPKVESSLPVQMMDGMGYSLTGMLQVSGSLVQVAATGPLESPEVVVDAFGQVFYSTLITVEVQTEERSYLLPLTPKQSELILKVLGLVKVK